MFRKSILLITCLFIAEVLHAIHLDTAKQNLCIFLNQNQDPQFIIPFNSINGEFQKLSYKGKLGSHSFKQRGTKDKYKCKLQTLTREKAVFKDGSILISFELKREHDRISLFISNSENASTTFDFLSTESENFFGGGVQFSHVNLKGTYFSNVAEENGIGRGDQPISRWTKLFGASGESHSTYYPLPYFVSTANKGFGIDTDQLIRIHFAPEKVQVNVQSSSFSVHLFSENSMLEILGRFSEINGRGNPIPSWALGTILGLQGGTKEIERKLNALDQSTSIDAIWIQDWVGKRQTKFGSRLNWKWLLDTLNYATIRSFCDERELKLLGYINPFFAETGLYTEEGLKKNFLLLNPKKRSGLFDFGGMEGYMLDLQNPDAVKWMKKIITDNLISNGFDGWMCDFGEWIDASDMRTGDGWHNAYIREWIQLNHEVITESGKELFFFHRSGSVRTAFFTQSMWLGDQMVTYGTNDGLPSVINALLSSGLSGLPPAHSDIGGYTAVDFKLIKKQLRTRELMLDWMKLEAFTPVFRTHEGLKPDIDLQVYSDPEIADQFMQYSHVHALLTPYFQSILNDYQLLGHPVFRHPILIDPDLQLPGSVFVGNDILITYDLDQLPLTLSDQFYQFTPNWKSDSEKSRIHIWIRKNTPVAELLKN